MKALLPLALLPFLAVSAPAAADTTADCGRFYLKYDPATKALKCVNGKRNTGNTGDKITSLARDLQNAVKKLQKALDGAEAVIRTRQQKQKELDGADAEQRTRQQDQEVEQRVREVINETAQRTRDVQQTARELAQAQRSLSQELASEQRQTVMAQVQLARELEQKQLALTQELIAQTRSRTQSITR